MPIRRLLENHVFGPDEITVLTSAFEDTLRTLRLVDRADPATEIIAKKIIELAQQASAIPSSCANARFNFCRNRPTPRVAGNVAGGDRMWASRADGHQIGHRLSVRLHQADIALGDRL
jgi:hypothetical protein